MTYDPIDTNDDGVVDADVDNQSVRTDELQNVRWVNGEDGAAAVQNELDNAASVASANQRQRVVVYGDGPVNWTESIDVPNHVTLAATDEFSVRIPDNHNLSTNDVGGGTFLYAVANKDFSGSATGVYIENLHIDFNGDPDDGSTKNQDQNAAGIWLHNVTDSKAVDCKAEKVLVESGDSIDPYRTWGILVSDSDESELRDCVGGPAGYEGIGIRGENSNIDVIECEGIQGDHGVHSMQAAGLSGAGVTVAGAGTSITFLRCEGDANINIHYGSDLIRDLCIKDSYMAGGYVLHGEIRNGRLVGNSGGKVEITKNEILIDGLTVDGHEAQGDNTVQIEPNSDEATIKNITIENVHKNSSGIVCRIEDLSTQEDAIFENITLRSCTNVAGGSVGLFLASGSATTVRRVVIDDCYTNETTAARVDGATVSTAIFRDCDLSDTDPFLENTGGSFGAAIINDEAEESASAEEPQQSYPAGVLVDFTDSGDGSGTGTYLAQRDGTFTQVA